ncbi:MAG: MlaE family lipid ABC transporter permease subunit [Notoacmeibacter sp.]|nr:MlaE family lipid ABC transporter permease subunit [Notoacmeibacter sp.]
MLNKAKQEATRGSDEPAIDARLSGDTLAVVLSGIWNTRTVQTVDSRMRELEKLGGVTTVTVDLSALHTMDTAGAWLVERFLAHCESNGIATRIVGDTEKTDILMRAVSHAAREPAPKNTSKPSWLAIDFLATVGKSVYEFRRQFLIAMHILGATVRGAQMKIGRSHKQSPAAIVTQIERMGIGAVPVVVLMSAIVGAIIAQQGAFQLRYFGAEIFVVDLVSVLVLRELGVLMTAIMVAGRTGSAITAELGSMKMREEIDALTVIGLNPVGVLVFPRLVALVVALPLLTVIADAAALGGAMLMAWFYSGITPQAFIQRMHDWIDLSTIFSGMIKAPFMALIIGVIASMEGLLVRGSAESLGRHVTASVVKAIFFVIVVDGLFSVFYGAIDY